MLSKAAYSLEIWSKLEYRRSHGRKLLGRQELAWRRKNMATTPVQRVEPNPQRSGRQLAAFGCAWISALLMILGGWLAISRVGRLLHWSKADAEVQRSEVYLVIQRSGARGTKPPWGARVTIRYLANGELEETTIDRGFQSAVRPWMEQWTRRYPAGSHKKILFNPADPLEADLDGEWSLASFSSPTGFMLAAVLFLWGWRRLR
jgi:Protein of unknown function (DUF3592)